tara:strand:+ start:1206 stop:1970 length:765 start_codon:yes stop_codon:yes gene_type:complete
MKKLKIIFFFISCIINAQEGNTDEILKSIYHKLIDNTGTKIDFKYNYNNKSHDEIEPIFGSISLSKNNRFNLKIKNQTINIEQFYDGKHLYTVLNDDKEIQIDNVDHIDDIIIHNTFQNFNKNFNSKISEKTKNEATISLKPNKTEYEIKFNNCIEILNMPQCLKFPNQCRIGIDSVSQLRLNNCIDNFDLKQNDILSVDIKYNLNNLDLKSITQLDKFGGKTQISILNLSNAVSDDLIFDSIRFKDFEIIDLR